MPVVVRKYILFVRSFYLTYILNKLIANARKIKRGDLTLNKSFSVVVITQSTDCVIASTSVPIVEKLCLLFIK